MVIAAFSLLTNGEFYPRPGANYYRAPAGRRHNTRPQLTPRPWAAEPSQQAARVEKSREADEMSSARSAGQVGHCRLAST